MVALYLSFPDSCSILWFLGMVGGPQLSAESWKESTTLKRFGTDFVILHSAHIHFVLTFSRISISKTGYYKSACMQMVIIQWTQTPVKQRLLL